MSVEKTTAALSGLLGAAALTLAGTKTLSVIEKTTAPKRAGTRRRGVPRTDVERLQRRFGKDWWKHNVSELPPRGTGLKRRKKVRRKSSRRKPRKKSRVRR